MIKVALIEFGNSHSEVLFPQFQFLEAHPSFEPHLFVSKTLKNRLYDYPKERLNFLPAQPRSIDYKMLHQKLKAQNFEKVVINTASGKKVRNFVWSSLSTSIEYYGVLHHLQKLRKSTTQGLINLRINRYFFLAEYLSKSAKALKPRMQFQHFYAGFLPEEAGSKTIIKPQGEKWIVIPGQVEYKRRDYLALLRSLEGQKQSNLRFILLGKSKHDYGDGVDLEARIKAQALQSQFKLWDDYVAADEFHQYLAQADYVLPLIHANHPSGSLYQQQISGAWNMATALKIPLLLEEGSPGCLDFADAALFYPPHGLNQIWKEKEPRPRGFYQHKKWSFEQQMQAYCQFLLD